MSKVIIKAKDWPFKNNEKAELIWIGEPFKNNNKWVVYAYFKGDKIRKKIMLDWATIHFLSVGKYYKNGNLNDGKVLENEYIMDIKLDGTKVEYKEKDWEIWANGFKDKTKSKTFNFFNKGILYTIPIIEIIRAILAPDRFMLNRILEMDTLDNYFTYEIEENKLKIYFTGQYEQKLLKNEKINHLAWILTNNNLFRMFNAIGYNMWDIGELTFDFLLSDFNIKARVNKNNTYVRILEIISLKKKRININEINVYHPSLEESKAANQPKKRKYISNNKSGNRDLSSQAEGSSRTSEEINTFLISHEYEKIPKINRVKTGRKIRRTKEDGNTRKYIIENGQDRTVADVGGEKLLPGLEFNNISDLKVEGKGEIEEFIEVLKLLQNRSSIKSVDIIIGNLPEGRKGKRFSKLKDGFTKRKYAIGKIVMVDGRTCSLIEVERENKALSMLLLKTTDKYVNWNWVYSILLLGLVDESGKWSNDDVSKIEKKDIVIYRNKHIRKDKYEKASYIYEKLNINIS